MENDTQDIIYLQIPLIGHMWQVVSESPRLAPLILVINALRASGEASERWSACLVNMFRGGPTGALARIDKSTVRKSFDFRRGAVRWPRAIDRLGKSLGLYPSIGNALSRIKALTIGASSAGRLLFNVI